MEEKKSSETLHKIGAVLLAIVPILVLFPPIVGFSFNLGYLSVFNLDNDAFPRSTIELWQYSYIVSLKWLGALIKPYSFIVSVYFAALVLVLLVGLVLVILRTMGKLPLSKKRYEALFGKKSFWGKVDLFTESCEMLYNEAKGFWYGFLILIFLPPLIAFVLIYPVAQGKEFAQETLNHYMTHGCVGDKWSYCSDYLNPNNPNAKSYRGLLVAASSTHIAIFDNNVVSVIPRSPEYVLTRIYNEGTKE